MTAKPLETLTGEELHRYKESVLYRDSVLSTYQYTDTILEYYDEYYNREYTNFSIVVFDSTHEPVLVLYAFSKKPVFSHFGLPVTVIEGVFNDMAPKNKAYKALIKKLNEILTNEYFSEAIFYNNDFLVSEYYSKTSLIEPEHNCYVDLSLPEDQLKANLRKSYKSLVNWGEKNMDYVIVDNKTPDRDRFNQFKDFHVSTAGRKTRSDRSWDLQFESIIGNEAYLMMGFLSGNIVAGSLVFFGKKEAYYGVGVYDRGLMKQNVAIGHYNVFGSILQAKKRGLVSFHLGYITQNNNDSKELNIFRFKAGFSNTMKVNDRHTAKLIMES